MDGRGTVCIATVSRDAVRGEEPIVRLVRKGVKHVLSHRVIYANFYEVILPENSASFAKYQRISVEDLHKFAVSRLVNQFFSLILEPNN